MEETISKKFCEDYIYTPEDRLRKINETIIELEYECINSSSPESCRVLKNKGIDPVQDQKTQQLHIACLKKERRKLIALHLQESTQTHGCNCNIS